MVPDRLIALPEVKHLVSLGTATIYRRMANGTFPKQVKLSATCARWRESAIANWIDALDALPTEPGTPKDAA